MHMTVMVEKYSNVPKIRSQLVSTKIKIIASVSRYICNISENSYILNTQHIQTYELDIHWVKSRGQIQKYLYLKVFKYFFHEYVIVFVFVLSEMKSICI